MNEHKVAYLPLWARYLELFRSTKMTNAQIGSMIVAMMEYQFEGKDPEKLSKILLGYWQFIRKDLDDARKKYMQSVNNGKKGAAKQIQNRAQRLAVQAAEAASEETTPDYPETTPEHPGDTLEPGKSMSMSRTISRSMSRTNTDHGCASAAPVIDLSMEKKICGEFGWVVLTEQQYGDLTALMGEAELNRCIAYIDESAQTTGNRNNWHDWHLVLRRCYQNRWHEKRSSTAGRDIPKGASGELGKAELEAIQAVLAQ